MQTVEDFDDTLLKSSASHYTVVDDNEVIHSALKNVVSDVIYMRSKVVARVAFGDESAQLDVLPCRFL